MTGTGVDPSPVLPWERRTLRPEEVWSKRRPKLGPREGPQSTHGPNVTFFGHGREHSAGKVRSRSESEGGAQNQTPSSTEGAANPDLSPHEACPPGPASPLSRLHPGTVAVLGNPLHPTTLATLGRTVGWLRPRNPEGFQPHSWGVHSPGRGHPRPVSQA